MAALYMNNIQKPANRPEYLLGKVTQPNESWLSETRSTSGLRRRHSQASPLPGGASKNPLAPYVRRSLVQRPLTVQHSAHAVPEAPVEIAADDGVEGTVAVSDEYRERQEADVDETREEVYVEGADIVRHPAYDEHDRQRDEHARQPLPAESGGRAASGGRPVEAVGRDGADYEGVRHDDDDRGDDVLDDEDGDTARTRHETSSYNR